MWNGLSENVPCAQYANDCIVVVRQLNVVRTEEIYLSEKIGAVRSNSE